VDRREIIGGGIVDGFYPIPESDILSVASDS